MKGMTREQIIERNRKISKGLERVCSRRSEEYTDKISAKKSVYWWNRKRDNLIKIRKKRQAFLKKHLTKIVPRENTYSGVVKK